MSDPKSIDATAGCRDGYEFSCGSPDCSQSFRGDDLGKIAKRAARHWNSEHHRDLKNQYEAIDEVVYDGYHVHGNSYTVEKYYVYLTSFDMMDRLGAEDGWLTRADDDATCSECHCVIPDEDDHIEREVEYRYQTEWHCRECYAFAEVSRKQTENRSLADF